MEIIELVKKCQAGETEAFAQIYDLFADKIYRFIALKINHKQQAEDILQEVFVKAWQGLPHLRLEELNFNAWLYKIASNTINDYLRRLYRRPEAMELNENIDLASGEILEAELGVKQDMETIRAAMEKLPKQYQAVLELRFVQDMDVSETAEILGKTRLAVRLLQHRALKQLRTTLANYYALEY